MYKKPLITAGLILGFSTQSVFAGNEGTGTNESKKRTDKFDLAKRGTTGLKSNISDIVINTRNVYEKSKSIRVITTKNPFSNKKTPPLRIIAKDSKIESTEPKKTAVEKLNARKRNGDLRSSGSSRSGKSTSVKYEKSLKTHVKKFSASNKRLYGAIYSARNLNELNPAQRQKIYEIHKRMAKTREGQILLRTVQKGEAGGLLVIVGKGQKKSPLFKQYMSKLTTGTHPAYQFPKDMRCFIHNRQLNRCSTAAGLYQITKTNYDFFVKYLGIKDFSRESQDIMALELIRTGQAIKVPGNYKGRGYVELLKGNFNNAIRYGTDDWASSASSRWQPHNLDYTKLAQTVVREMGSEKTNLKDSKYFQNWIDEAESKTKS